LLAREEVRREFRTRAPGQSEERDASWLDYSNLLSIDRDGTAVAFIEMGDGGGPGSATYLRRPGDRPPVQIASGIAAHDLSRDGKWLLSVIEEKGAPRIYLLPTGAGERRALETAPLEYHWVWFSGDAKRIFFVASATGKGPRVYVQDVGGGAARPITPEGI